jgi:adenosylhomocysteine nucleosidase
MIATVTTIRLASRTDVTVVTGLWPASAMLIAFPDIEAVISLGLCGGLGPAQIGQAFIYDAITDGQWTYFCDAPWRKRLFAATKYYETKCYSTGQFNTANTVEQRADLYAKFGCRVIDDESIAVAEFAMHRDKPIPFIGLRVVSDGAEDNLPPAVQNALQPDGGDNILAVIASLIQDPAQIPLLEKTAKEAQFAIDELGTPVKAVGPYFQAQA